MAHIFHMYIKILLAVLTFMFMITMLIGVVAGYNLLKATYNDTSATADQINETANVSLAGTGRALTHPDTPSPVLSVIFASSSVSYMSSTPIPDLAAERSVSSPVVTTINSNMPMNDLNTCKNIVSPLPSVVPPVFDHDGKSKAIPTPLPVPTLPAKKQLSSQ